MLPQFVIVFRESLEATLIIVVVSSYLYKLGRPEVRKHLYLGAVSAVLVSLSAAAFASVVFGGLGDKAEHLFEGFASLGTMGVLTYMVLWMARKAPTIRQSLERRVAASVRLNQKAGIFGLGFVSILREGLETVLFLSPLLLSDPLGTFAGTIAAISAIMALTVATMGALVRMSLARLFKYTSLLLLVFSAGLAGYGVHELIEAYNEQMPGVLARHAWDVNPTDPRNPFHENGLVGSILKSLVGYDGNPEILRVIVYVAYWIILVLVLRRTYGRREIPAGPPSAPRVEANSR